MEEKKRRPKCYNCKHHGEYFKVVGNNHHHCNHPKWTDEGFENGEFSAWDTLQVWWDTCADHEFNQ